MMNIVTSPSGQVPPSGPGCAPDATDSAVSAAQDGPLPAAAFDLLPDSVIVTDAAGVVEVFNRAAAKLTGVDGPSAIGRHLTEVLPLLDERGNDWWECSTASRNLPRVTGQPERRLTYAGPVHDRDFHVTVRFNRVAGRLVRVSLSLRDTLSRERLERNRADLVATVAHELRSPLTSVKGFTATLLAKWDRFTDEQKKLMLNTVNTDADRVTRLLTEVLDVSRIDSGRIQVRKQIVDLPARVRSVVDGKVASGAAGADRFFIREEGELPEMWVDPDKIEQVLHNLVDNALRHGAGTVTVLLRGRDSGTEVSVADEGEGVSESNAARVFTKFWRGASRGNGTGLGLYIAKALIEAHGGTISVGRAPGGGAEFRFFVPAGGPVFG
ncbi:PAS/PAC sensor signal transduction histidine kinase [Frankia casuarinae]|nr:PAS/PAC sensor signal transduction histidine kinase [Frankia sp. CcI6]EYT90951.1 PAS/PAC sensor signal transduction histidine kinase [Frankia casuarinae]KDA42114.1 PAS/PAC sensor signal transduction histidine kinase [Frankia sp. BMG5.23]KEZ35507.1 PAS/PAC sensor signal transduction histidine kinase [Frankia sp. CeD]KFB03675.1 PAS/PAC sensor signal transduction histidine kinase [Frankia sp. Allo2]